MQLIIAAISLFSCFLFSIVWLLLCCFSFLPLLACNESERTSALLQYLMMVPEWCCQGLQLDHFFWSYFFAWLTTKSNATNIAWIYLYNKVLLYMHNNNSQVNFVFPDLQLCVIQSSAHSLSHQVSHKWRTDSSHCPSTASACWWGCHSPITLCSWIQWWNHQDIWPGKSGNDHEDAASCCFSYCNIILSPR